MVEEFIKFDVYGEERRKLLKEFLEKKEFLPLREKIFEIMLYRNKYLACYNVNSLDDIQGHERHRNIWCFNKDGNLLWRIQPIKTEKPFAGFGFNKSEGRLKAFSQMDLVFDLDIETGAISNPRQTK